MKIEITLKSGVQSVMDVDSSIVAINEHRKLYPDCVVYGSDLESFVLNSEIAAIRRIEEVTQTFEPVDNDPENVYERELAKEKERWER